MVNFRQFTISDDLFSGFTRPVDLDSVENIEEIIAIVVDELKNVFKNNNFDILRETVEKRNLLTIIHLKICYLVNPMQLFIYVAIVKFLFLLYE
jgi:hypothetical protein